VVLGSGGATLTARRDNTSLALRMDETAVLIDTPGSVTAKLLRAGIDPMRLSAVVITHTHPDHIYGLPSLVHNLWMMNRAAALPVFAPEEDLEKLQHLLAIFDLMERAVFLEFHAIPGDPGQPFWEHGGHRLSAHAVDHGPPAFAIRWDTAGGHRVLHSSDTRPVDALARFGYGAALFLHEATYTEDEAARAATGGHSTAGQAGRMATLAGARRLLLLHLSDSADPVRWVAEAMTMFAGPVEVPDDGAVYAVE
jgi:ribonuclease Z